MSVSSLLPVGGIVASGAPGLVCGASKLGWKPLVLDRIPSFRLHGCGVRITACAAPCESLQVASPGAAKVGFGGLTFESSVLQCVKEGLVFHEGRVPEVIRAAAYLRALSFYTYPEGRTEEALKLHRKMKTDDEFTALTSKVAGLEQGYKRIVCILALYPLSCLDDRSLVELHPALKVSDVMKTLRLIDAPCHRFGMYVMRVRVDFVWSFGGLRVMRLSEQVTLSGEEHVLVGSLDLNQGRILPGEIAGSKPEGLSADRERGYLSNVCVAPLMRQRGIGAALLQQAQKMAQLWGITNLYVHVVATNEAAVKLYNKGGFIVEREESASDARRQARPRRSLLHRFI